MQWILMFKRAATMDGCVCKRVDCTEEELQGAKEVWAMELEENTGEIWICGTILPVKPQDAGGKLNPGTVFQSPAWGKGKL